MKDTLRRPPKGRPTAHTGNGSNISTHSLSGSSRSLTDSTPDTLPSTIYTPPSKPSKTGNPILMAPSVRAGAAAAARTAQTILPPPLETPVVQGSSRKARPPNPTPLTERTLRRAPAGSTVGTSKPKLTLDTTPPPPPKPHPYAKSSSEAASPPRRHRLGDAESFPAVYDGTRLPVERGARERAGTAAERYRENPNAEAEIALKIYRRYKAEKEVAEAREAKGKGPAPGYVYSRAGGWADGVVGKRKEGEAENFCVPRLVIPKGQAAADEVEDLSEINARLMKWCQYAQKTQETQKTSARDGAGVKDQKTQHRSVQRLEERAREMKRENEKREKEKERRHEKLKAKISAPTPIDPASLADLYPKGRDGSVVAQATASPLRPGRPPLHDVPSAPQSRGLGLRIPEHTGPKPEPVVLKSAGGEYERRGTQLSDFMRTPPQRSPSPPPLFCYNPTPPLPPPGSEHLMFEPQGKEKGKSKFRRRLSSFIDDIPDIWPFEDKPKPPKDSKLRRGSHAGALLAGNTKQEGTRPGHTRGKSSHHFPKLHGMLPKLRRASTDSDESFGCIGISESSMLPPNPPPPPPPPLPLHVEKRPNMAPRQVAEPVRNTVQRAYTVPENPFEGFDGVHHDGNRDDDTWSNYSRTSRGSCEVSPLVLTKKLEGKESVQGGGGMQAQEYVPARSGWKKVSWNVQNL